MQNMGFVVGRLTSETVVKGTIKNALKARLGVPEDVIRLYEHPYVYLNEEEIKKTKYSIAAIHCSPWRYDTYVPLFFAGYGIPSQRITRPVTPYDIAATIAIYLEIKPPSGSVGIPLVEVLEGK